MASNRDEAKHREDVKKMTDEELAVELTSERNKLFSLRSSFVTEKVEDVSQFGKHKRNVARILTEQGQRLAKADGKPAPASPAAAKTGKKKTTRKTAKAAAR